MFSYLDFENCFRTYSFNTTNHDETSWSKLSASKYLFSAKICKPNLWKDYLICKMYLWKLYQFLLSQIYEIVFQNGWIDIVVTILWLLLVILIMIHSLQTHKVTLSSALSTGEQSVIVIVICYLFSLSYFLSFFLLS